MATITPTLTLTSNAASATTLPGPLSVALSLSATDALSVDTVQSKIVTVSATHAVLWDASAISDGTQTAGTDGGFVYVKNLTGTSNIYIGYGTAANMAADDTAIRLMTLLPGEFAWFPWDLNADIAVDAAGAGTLETWYFDRG
tara:strand:+ start:7236 stop:7664 length:429 start_codon:yes stop_codon:yes gene_type:complete